MPRFLGIDYGTKRIGLAVSDSAASLASPLKTLESAGGHSAVAAELLVTAQEFEIAARLQRLQLFLGGE